METPSLFPEFDNQTQMLITDTQPTPLLKDFDVFARHLKARQVSLSRSREHLPGRLLHEINAEMSIPWPDTTTRTAQFAYPLLHLFHHLVLAGRLFRKSAGRGGRLTLVSTPRLEAYEKLTPTERYFFLLETLWVDTDWVELGKHWQVTPLLMELALVLPRLARLKPGRRLALGQEKNAKTARILDRWDLFLMVFAHFGFWNVVPSPAPPPPDWPRHTFMAEAVIPTLFGTRLAGILGEHRDIWYWNLSRLRLCGVTDVEFDEPFRRPFAELFPEGTLERSLRFSWTGSPGRSGNSSRPGRATERPWRRF